MFPGGSAKIDDQSGYGRAGKKIYTLVLAHGAAGNPIPLWGTSLGFEMLVRLVANNNFSLTNCQAINLADTLQLQPGEILVLQGVSKVALLFISQ